MRSNLFKIASFCLLFNIAETKAGTNDDFYLGFLVDTTLYDLNKKNLDAQEVLDGISEDLKKLNGEWPEDPEEIIQKIEKIAQCFKDATLQYALINSLKNDFKEKKEGSLKDTIHDIESMLHLFRNLMDNNKEQYKGRAGYIKLIKKMFEENPRMEKRIHNSDDEGNSPSKRAK